MLKGIGRITAAVVMSVFLFCGVFLHASAEEGSAALTDSADSYIEAVEKASGGDVIYHLYYDFDEDGKNEMFALVQKEPSDSRWDEETGVMGGRLWYVNADGAIEVMSRPKPYYKDPEVLKFDGQSVLPLHQVFATGTRTYLWGVLGGKPYELNASGRISGLSVNEYGEIEGIGEDYNASWSKESDDFSGHTWNTYYFYYDHGNIREYGGVEITWEEFCRIPGIEAVKEKIEKEIFSQGGKIQSIYYRGNGIVAVNIEKEEQYSVNYSNLQMRITKKGVRICAAMSDSDYAAGTVGGALLDELATYPEAFPY